jgi:hypothetical protein
VGVDLVIVDLRLVGQGYRAHKLIGRTVLNDMKETIGTLDDVIITSEATANDIGRDDDASPGTLMEINFLTNQSEKVDRGIARHKCFNGRLASDRGAIDLALCLYPT